MGKLSFEPDALDFSFEPNAPYSSVADDVVVGDDVYLGKFINLYNCIIGDNCKIGAFVEIQKNARVGNNCKISSHSFLCEGVTLEDNVFIGHGVTFINDKFPRSTTVGGAIKTGEDWTVSSTLVQQGASIGSNATILCSITIGKNAIVGAGSVVTKSVPENTVVAGNPAKFIRKV